MKIKLDAGFWAAKTCVVISGVVCTALILRSSLLQPRRARVFFINICHSCSQQLSVSLHGAPSAPCLVSFTSNLHTRSADTWENQQQLATAELVLQLV